ncbi:hypothetical protein ACVIGB_000091 [Bradyrhizobium sp. USDA 4341]
MKDVGGDFALVIEHDDIRRQIPDWPEQVMLATTVGAAGAETRAFHREDADLRSFVGSLPVVPARVGFPLALPNFEEEHLAWDTAISQARTLLDAGDLPFPSVPAPEDRFADLDDDNQAPSEPTRYWMRRVHGGFEIRSSSMPMFPWGVDRVSIGASTLGIHPTDQPLDRVLTFSVTADGVDTISAVAKFLPTSWQEVPLVQGAAGAYFDVSSVVLAALSQRNRLAIKMSIAGLATGVIGIALLLSILIARL